MSVKVAVRVRPYNERELTNAKAAICCIDMDGPTTTITDPGTNLPRPFTFDYSFWSHDDFVDKDGYTFPASENS
jgi:kinesin family protein 1